MGYVICNVIWILILYLCLRIYKNIINKKCEDAETEFLKLFANTNEEISILRTRLLEEEHERKKRGLKIKELFSKIKELSDLLESEKQRADVNNDLLNQRCEEVDELKTSLRLEEEQRKCWKGSANSLGEKLDKEAAKNKELVAQIEKMHLSEPTEYFIVDDFHSEVKLLAHYDEHSALIKAFRDRDMNYNFGLALELKEKLEEKI